MSAAPVVAETRTRAQLEDAIARLEAGLARVCDTFATTPPHAPTAPVTGSNRP